MTTLTKIKLKIDERGCWRKLQKGPKKRDKQQRKDVKNLTK